MVGAVVVRDGEVVGEGWHRRVGGPHAEVEALAAVARRDPAGARGATVYVTLEPCAHHGRTPPCAEALIAAGVARVVACHRDPDPRVGGRGFAALRAAGIEVEVGPLAAEAARLNLRYLTAAVEKRPAVTLKWAMSVDGKIATTGGESQWISGRAARRWALALREEHDAVVVGAGTALADDPRLTRRLGLAGAPNLRAVLDRRLRLPPTARMLGEPGPVVVYTRPGASRAHREELTARGAEVVELPVGDPAAVLADLFARGVRSVLVEGGGEVHEAFASAALVDRVEVACAALLIGGRTAPGPLGGPGAPSLAESLRLSEVRARRRGPDLILSGLREGCLDHLLAGVRPPA